MVWVGAFCCPVGDGGEGKVWCVVRDKEAEDRLARADRRAGEWLRALAEGRGVEGLQGGQLVSARIRMPRGDDPSALLVVKATDVEGDWVAFVGGTGPLSLMLKWRADAGSGGLRWRVDVPWGERGGQ